MTDLRTVLRGTFVLPEHYPRVKAYLRQAVDETDAHDRLDAMKRREPEIFTTGKEDLRDTINEVLRQSGVSSVGWPVVKSFLRWCSSRESMMATVDKLRSHREWFRRQR